VFIDYVYSLIIHIKTVHTLYYDHPYSTVSNTVNYC